MAVKQHVVIIGSGLGGLLCGAILSKNGFQVTIVEANRQIGGNLQVYVRDRQLFDAAVHYIGGVKPGQNLYSIFSYLEILEELHLEELDNDGFDKIVFEGDPTEYPHASTSNGFIDTLASHFPEEEDNLRKYVHFIEETCSAFPLFNLQNGSGDSKEQYLKLNARDTIASFTSNHKLRSVLAGSNMLYAGEGDRTPFHVHALTTYSYMLSAFRFKKGSSMLAKALKDVIIRNEGEIRTRAIVTNIEIEKGKATSIRLRSGEKINGDVFISNAHPLQTLDMLDEGMVRQIYIDRIRSLENTVAPFMINLTYPSGLVPYRKYNYYGFRNEDVWNSTKVKGDDWPHAYGIFYAPHRKQEEFADGVSILTYMPISELAPWLSSSSTVTFPEERPADYMRFKSLAENKLLSVVSDKFPLLSTGARERFSATPLSYRDYLLNGDGNMYGILKDYQDPIRTQISPRMKVPNLFLTGQNLNLHGVTGVCMSALLTCSCFLDLDLLLQDIRTAHA